MRLPWVTTLTSTPVTRDAAPEPEAAPQPDTAQQHTSEMNHLDWMGVLEENIWEVLRENISPAGGKPSPCLKEGESDSAAVEPTDVTTIQAPAEPRTQSQPAAVTPVQRRKYKTKSV